MPKVPTYDNFAVDINAAPGDRYQAGQASQPLATPPGGFQPGVIQPIQINNVPALSEGLATIGGRQMAAAGDALQRAGTSMAQVAFDAQRQMNELRVDDSLNKTKELAMRMQFDKDKGFMSLAGWDALHRESGKPLYQEFGDKLRDQVNAIADGMGNEAQKQTYMMRANDMVTQFEGQAQNHMLQQAKIYSVSVAKGTIENQMNEIGLNYNDPTRVNEAIEGRYGLSDGQVVLVQKGLKQAVYDYGRANGMAEPEIEALTRQKVSNAHVTALKTALEQSDVTYANAYLTKYRGQMDANDILTVQSVLTKEYSTHVAMGAASAVMGGITPKVDSTSFDRVLNITERAESGGNDYAPDGSILTSSKGAQGRMQVMPATAANPGFGVTPARNDTPEEKARVGREFMGAMIKEYNGSLPKAWAAYNWGPGNLNKAIEQAKKGDGDWLALAPKETQDYVTRNTQAFADGGGHGQIPTRQDVHDQIRARLGPNTPPAVVRMALDEGTRQFEDLTSARKQRDDELVADAQRALVQSKGNWTALSPTILADLQARAPGKIDELQTFAGKIAQGVPIKTNLEVYNALVSDPVSVAKLTDAQFMNYQRDLSPEDSKTVANIRAKFQGNEAGGTGGPGDLNLSAINDNLDDQLTVLKINPTPKADGGEEAARVGGIRKFVVDYFTSAQNEAGKKFSDAEVRDHMDRLFTKTQSIPGLFGDTSKQVMNMVKSDIDSSTRLAIQSALRKRGINSPTDSQIMNAYFHLKVSAK
jgi:soluble lytic murein transglycosylase